MTDIKTMPDWAKQILEKQEALEAENVKLKEDIVMFKELAGKAKMADYADSKRDLTQKFAHFKTNNGKVIIGWGRLDYSQFNANAKNALDENLLIDVVYADGSTEKLNYSVFTNIKSLIKAKILTDVKLNSLTVEVEFEDGTKRTVERSYLNA